MSMLGREAAAAFNRLTGGTKDSGPVDGVSFGEPPGDTRWAPVARALRARPGEWAEVDHPGADNARRASASSIKKGALKAFRPAGHFEAKTAGYRLWVRYVGPS